MSHKIRVQADTFRIVSDALDTAVESAMNRTDKWCEEQLTDAQRHVLVTQAASYFWIALQEAGVELV